MGIVGELIEGVKGEIERPKRKDRDDLGEEMGDGEGEWGSRLRDRRIDENDVFQMNG